MSKSPKAPEGVAEVSEPPDDDVAQPELVKIAWRDAEFTVPKDMDDWDTDACIALMKGSESLENAQTAIRLALGEVQFEGLRSLGWKRRDLKEFAIQFGKVVDEECV